MQNCDIPQTAHSCSLKAGNSLLLDFKTWGEKQPEEEAATQDGGIWHVYFYTKCPPYCAITAEKGKPLFK